MNRTIISIEIQDNAEKETIIIIKGKCNNPRLFEEQSNYMDEEKHHLRYIFFQKDFIINFPN